MTTTMMTAAGLALSLTLGTVELASAQPGPWARGSEGAQVSVEHAAARLVVIAEPRRDISVTVQHGPSRLPQLAVRREGDRIVVDGLLSQPFGGERIDCRGGINQGPFGVSDQRAVVVGGYGHVAYNDLPVITARVPLDAEIAGEGAVFGDVSATRSLALASSGCGGWNIGPVHERLEASLSGSADLHGVDVGALHAVASGSSDIYLGHVANGAEVLLSGSGDLHVAAINGPLTARVAGSGNLTAGRIDGPIRAEISGSGDLRLPSGYAQEVVARVAGSGELTFGGKAGRVDAVATGSGDIHIAHATGPVMRVTTGGADVVVGR
jgi:hypothetical protein